MNFNKVILNFTLFFLENFELLLFLNAKSGWADFYIGNVLNREGRAENFKESVLKKDNRQKKK